MRLFVIIVGLGVILGAILFYLREPISSKIAQLRGQSPAPTVIAEVTPIPTPTPTPSATPTVSPSASATPTANPALGSIADINASGGTGGGTIPQAGPAEDILLVGVVTGAGGASAYYWRAKSNLRKAVRGIDIR